MNNSLETTAGGDMIVRFVKEEDAVQMIELQMRLANETDFLLRELEEVEIDAEKQRDEIRQNLLDDTKFLIGIYEHGRLIGYISGQRGRFSRNRHVANFLIGVLKEHWGKGAARQLMDTFIEWSKNEGLARIEIEVVEDNERALAFYYQYGFKIEGKKEADHYVDGAYLNTYLLAKVMKTEIMI